MIFYNTIKIKNREVSVIVLIILLSAIIYNGSAQQYDFREFSDGLAQPYVYSMVQDNNGYLWIGTGNGLTRYDGKQFKSFTTDDSLAGNFITCSFRDEDNLWFGHMNGNVSHFDGNEFKPMMQPGLKSRITDIEKSPDEGIWVSSFTNGLVNLLDIDHHSPVNQNNQLAIHSFAFVTDREILVGSVDGLKLARINNAGEVEIIRHFREIPASNIHEIIKMNNDSGFYVATENKGIFRIKQDGDTFDIIPVASGLNAIQDAVQGMLEDRESDLWISTLGNGLVKLMLTPSGKLKDTIHFNEGNNFTTNNVKTVFEDREGNIWSGNYGRGLTQLIKRPFKHFVFDDEGDGPTIHAVYVHQDMAWLALDKRLLKVDRSSMKVLDVYNTDHGLPDDPITTLFTNKGDTLWIGTRNRGLYSLVVEQKEIKRYHLEGGILENSITAITGQNDQVWVGTKKGICNINTITGDRQWYTIEKGGLPHNYINQLMIDSRNRLWVTTLSNTLVYIQHGKVEKLTIESENGIIGFGPLSESSDSTIWVGSNGGGIYRVMSDSIANITTEHGLFSDYCYSLLADHNGDIWVGHRGGLSKINTSNYWVRTFDQHSGINSSGEFKKNALIEDQDRKVWAGSENGLWVYDPVMDNYGSIPPLLNITSIWVNDQLVDPGQKLVLPPGDYKLSVEFLGIHLRAPDDIIYQYQLLGYDQSPVNTENTRVIYPKLNDGEYTFIIKAYTSDGIMSTSPRRLNITIKAPVWKQWWFYVLVSMLLVITVITIIRKREQRYRKEKQILETKVEERTSELAGKNEMLTEKQKTITEQNDELIKYRNYLEQLVEERTEELEKAKNKAEESDKLKTAFLENLSHEIRTPMNGILGFLSLLQDPGLDDITKDDFLNVITKSSHRMFNTINDIVEISKIESNQITVRYSEVNVVELVNEHFNFFKPKIEYKGLQFKNVAQISDQDLYVRTDKHLIDSVFTNIINNAIKFTNNGTIEIGNYLKNNTITFYVKDTGIGIPADRQEAIFERFVQADISANREHQGSGLGLSIVKAYIAILEGTIWVESAPGKGSTFYFLLPDKPIKIERKAMQKRVETDRLSDKKHTILFAEDDRYSFMYIDNVLKKLNVDLIHAINGQEAIQKLKDNPDVSLILMDIKMPVMGGLEATYQIRKFNKTIPIIAQTAYAMAGDKEKALEAGCNDYITKPINSKELIQLIKKYV